MKTQLMFGLIFLLGTPFCWAQAPTGHALKIFNTINAARQDPKGFANKHEAKIKAASPRYWACIQNAKPLPALSWDPALWQMGKEYVEQNNLDPQYKGKNKDCGHSALNGIERQGIDPIDFTIENLNNVTSPSIEHFGIYIKGDQKFYCIWAYSCQAPRYHFSFNDAIDTSKVDFNKLNTARNASYLSATEKQMVQEINFARAYPKIYAKIVAQYMAQQSKDRKGLTWEEYQAGLELINELDTMQPRSILQPIECLQKAAKLHAADCQKRGFFDHQGSDNSMPWDRIERQCKQMEGNENLCGAAGHFSVHPRPQHINLLIDGGIPSRGHRDNALDPQWFYVAVAQINLKDMKGFVQKFGRIEKEEEEEEDEE
jgi:uncharacterized protein YkwD